MQNQKRSLKARIVMLVAMMSGVTLLVGALGFFGMQTMSAIYSEIAEVNVPKVQYLGKMYDQFKETRIHLRTLGLSGLSAEERAQAKASALEYMQKYDESAQKFSRRISDEQKKLYTALDSEWLAFKQLGARILKLADSGNSDDDKQLLQIFRKDCPEAAERFRAEMHALSTAVQKEVEQDGRDAQNRKYLAQGMSLGAIVAGLLISFLLGSRIAKGISSSVAGIAKVLTQETDGVAAAATQIASTSQELSASATEQASALQETASSVEEMSAMVRKNAENAQSSSNIAAQSANSANEGRQVVDEMVRAIEEINEANGTIMTQIEESNRAISEITQVIAEIGNKTKVINDIVFQTKLLSFNASVEAARAGEHGKGFAVVAEEVGNLAQMSGNAATEISAMLEGSIARVEGIVQQTKTKVESLVQLGRTKVEAGTRVAQRCREVLDGLAQNVAEVNQKVTEISTASTEQAQGVAEINKAMGQLDQVTHQNASASHQASSAAEQLAAQSQRLKQACAELILEIQGGAGSKNSGQRLASEQSGTVQAPFEKIA